MSKSKKKMTRKFNRKIETARKLAVQQALGNIRNIRKQVLDEVKGELLDLIPISMQVVEAADVGLVGTISVEVDAAKYLKLLRKE